MALAVNTCTPNIRMSANTQPGRQQVTESRNFIPTIMVRREPADGHSHF